MTQSEASPSEPEDNPGIIMRLLRWSYRLIKNGYTWFTLQEVVLPEDEAGELMHRTLAQKSWFDVLTSSWVEQPFVVKCFLILGATLTAGIVGLWFGAALSLMVIVGCVALGIHTLFVAHEHQRRHSAKVMAEETIALNELLKAHEQVFEEVVEKVNLAADNLETYSEEMKDNAVLLKEQTENMKQQKELLEEQACIVTQATEELVQTEKQAQESYQRAVDSLEELTEVVIQTKEHVEDLSNAVSKFTVSVDSIDSSQQRYAEMVMQFGLFVQKQQTERENEDLVLQHSTSYYPFMDDLNAELDENDLLIEQMRQFMVSSPA